jgi:hypothetical protein
LRPLLFQTRNKTRFVFRYPPLHFLPRYRAVLKRDESYHMSFVRFLVNDKGRKEGVLIDIKLYEKILEELEELESLRAYNKAKASGDEILPIRKGSERARARTSAEVTGKSYHR